MNYFRILGLAWRWSWLLVLGLLIGGAGAYGASRLQSKVYQSTATILVNQAREGPTLTYNDVLANQQLAKTYTSLVRRRPVLEQAEQNLNMPAGSLNGAVQTTLPRDTQLIEITAHANTGQKAADIANEVGKVFSNQVQTQQTDVQTTAARKLDEQITALQATQKNASAEEASRAIQTTLDSLDKQRQSVRAGLITSTNSVSIAEQAEPSAAPVKPRVLMNTVLGAMLGLLAAAGIVALFEYLDDTVKMPNDLRQIQGTAPLGVITRFSGRRGAASSALITSMDSQSQAIEAYRMLRTSLEFSPGCDPGSSVLITSAGGGEGKSTTAANLALAVAQTGRRVVLVDGDMRHPSLHQLFNADNAMGLSVLLYAEGNEVDVAHDLQSVADNLLLLPSGPIPANPAELLASRRFEYVIEQLKHSADLIIVDSPPLLQVTDASAVAGRLDGTILVTEAYHTRMREVRQALQTLHQVNANVWGIVLNKMRVPKNHSPLLYGSGPLQPGKWEPGPGERSAANL